MLGQHGFLAHVFSVFNRYAASVDVIATSEVTVSLTLDEGYKHVDVPGIERELREVAKAAVGLAFGRLFDAFVGGIGRNRLETGRIGPFLAGLGAAQRGHADAHRAEIRLRAWHAPSSHILEPNLPFRGLDEPKRA